MSALELDRGKPERIYDDDGDIDDREIAIAMGEKEKDNFFLAGDDQPALGSLPASKAVNINKPVVEEDDGVSNKSKNFFVLAQKLAKLSVPELPLLIAGSLALLIGTLCFALIPAFLGLFIDAITNPDKEEAMNQLLLVVFGIFVLLTISAIFSFFRAMLFSLAAERVVARLRIRLFSHIMDQEIGFFDISRTGELMSRLSNDAGVLQSAVTTNVSMLLRFTMMALISVIILLIISPLLSLVASLIVPPLAIFAVLFAKFFRTISAKTQKALAVANIAAEESISNIRTVRSFGNEGLEKGKYSSSIASQFSLARMQAVVYGLFQGVMLFLGAIAMIIVLLLGGFLVIYGGEFTLTLQLPLMPLPLTLTLGMTAGTLVTFLLYCLLLGGSLAAMSALIGDFFRAMGASERIFQLLERQTLMQAEGGVSIANTQGELALRDVSFAYPSRSERIVLNNFSLSLLPGGTTALVGMSGAGKSTVAHVLMRFYDPSSGCITLDGVDLRDLDPTWLRHQFAMVTQEPSLFAVSLADNIRYGQPEASLDQVIAAAKAANAHEFIAGFVDGYDTLVGERGVRLSGGQKQRVAIARALLRDPQLLLLDEATSALDAESEHLVQQALESLIQSPTKEGKKRTVLVIAHRLSTIQKADCVVVVQDGIVEEQGTHQELMSRKGVYRQLVSRQLDLSEVDEGTTTVPHTK